MRSLAEEMVVQILHLISANPNLLSRKNRQVHNELSQSEKMNHV